MGSEIKNGKLIFTPDRIPKKTDAELDFLDPTEMPEELIQKHKENFERIIIETNENISIIRKNIKTAETEIDTDNLTGCINLINKLDKNYMDRIQKLMYVKNLLI